MNGKYIYPKGDFISGFGEESGYEQECQKMVIRGMNWFDENSGAEPKFKQYKNITGIIDEDNEDAKALVKAVLAEGDGQTGAMVQAAINHCLYAKKNGWDKYISEITQQ